MAMRVVEKEIGAKKTILAGANSPYFAVEQLLEKNSDLATSVNGRKIVKAGTIYPANDETAQGIILSDYDVTDGDVNAAMLVMGVVVASKLPVEITEEAFKRLNTIRFLPIPEFESSDDNNDDQGGETTGGDTNGSETPVVDQGGGSETTGGSDQGGSDQGGGTEGGETTGGDDQGGGSTVGG